MKQVPVVLDTVRDKVCQWLATGRWFSPDTPVSSTNKTDRHEITEILSKVAFNIIIRGLIKMSAFDWSMTLVHKTHAPGL
jgi:hypothetical protein